MCISINENVLHVPCGAWRIVQFHHSPQHCCSPADGATDPLVLICGICDFPVETQKEKVSFSHYKCIEGTDLGRDIFTWAERRTNFWGGMLCCWTTTGESVSGMRSLFKGVTILGTFVSSMAQSAHEWPSTFEVICLKKQKERKRQDIFRYMQRNTWQHYQERHLTTVSDY